MRTAWTILLALTAISTRAQEIGGQVRDEKKDPVISATVKVFRNGIQTGSTTTDYDGNYAFKVAPGTYNIVILHDGHNSIMTTSVPVKDARYTEVNYTLSKVQGVSKTIITAYKQPLYCDKHKEDIFPPPTTDINYHVYSNCRDCGSGSISFGGTRGEVVYIVDGVVIKSDPFVEVMSLMPSTREFHLPGHYTFSHNDISYMPATNVRDLPFVFNGITMR